MIIQHSIVWTYHNDLTNPLLMDIYVVSDLFLAHTMLQQTTISNRSLFAQAYFPGRLCFRDVSTLFWCITFLCMYPPHFNELFPLRWILMLPPSPHSHKHYYHEHHWMCLCHRLGCLDTQMGFGEHVGVIGTEADSVWALCPCQAAPHRHFLSLHYLPVRLASQIGMGS